MRNLARQLDEIFEVEPNEDVMLEMRLQLQEPVINQQDLEDVYHIENEIPF